MISARHVIPYPTRVESLLNHIFRPSNREYNRVQPEDDEGPGGSDPSRVASPVEQPPRDAARDEWGHKSQEALGQRQPH